MSHFYSSCEGGRGRATRCGHKTTGIRAMARIHELSVYVTGSHDNETGNDTFTIQVTLDDDRMVFDNSEPSHIQTLAPLVIRYDKNSHSVQLVHDVKPGDDHNVTSQQASFCSLGDY